MPHLIIEHSANLEARVDVAALVSALHRSALATGVAPLVGLRTRALRSEHYEVADGDPRNVYVAITARLGRGRSDAERRALIDALVDATETELGAAAEFVALSVEYQEIDPDLRVNKNHLRDRLGDA